jgi:hypothetical protein
MRLMTFIINDDETGIVSRQRLRTIESLPYRLMRLSEGAGGVGFVEAADAIFADHKARR